MSHDDPFTLSPIGTTSLSSGLGLGVAAFGDDLAANDIDDDPPPTAPAPSLPAPTEVPRARQAASSEPGVNFRLSGSRDLAKGWKSRAKDNLAAIRLAAEIEPELLADREGSRL